MVERVNEPMLGPNDTGRSARLLNIVAGIWLFISAFVWTHTMAQRTNTWIMGIIIAAVVNMFIASSALQFAISVIGVLVFTGLTAYDTQKIKEMYAEHHGVETSSKLAVMGALSLYLNFINLFQMLLHLMGTREE